MKLYTGKVIWRLVSVLDDQINYMYKDLTLFQRRSKDTTRVPHVGQGALKAIWSLTWEKTTTWLLVSKVKHLCNTVPKNEKYISNNGIHLFGVVLRKLSFEDYYGPQALNNNILHVTTWYIWEMEQMFYEHWITLAWYQRSSILTVDSEQLPR